MLVNCVAYQVGRKLADIPKEDIGGYVKRPDCFVWVALKEPEPAELKEMREQFGLHELAIEDASHGHQRPKLEEYGNSLFVVLQAVELRENELQIGEIEIFVGPNYILSVRMHTERGFQSVRARCENEPHLLKHGAAFVLYARMDAIVDRYFPVLDALESELERIEDQIFKRNTRRRALSVVQEDKVAVMIAATRYASRVATSQRACSWRWRRSETSRSVRFC